MDTDAAAHALDELARTYGTDKGSGGGRYGHPHLYMPIYASYLAKLRMAPLRLLEIGVDAGASLRMWEGFFPNARIVGIDNNPAAAAFASARSIVAIGDGTDAAFVTDVVRRHFDGEIDIVVDDATHVLQDQLAILQTLFPYLRDGGYYFIEDTTCARFWRPGTSPFKDFFDFASHLAEQTTYFPDSPDAPYHSITDIREVAPDATWPVRSVWNNWLYSIAIFHNICVLEKRQRIFPHDPPGGSAPACEVSAADIQLAGRRAAEAARLAALEHSLRDAETRLAAAQARAATAEWRLGSRSFLVKALARAMVATGAKF